jgi:hypothetical protein
MPESNNSLNWDPRSWSVDNLSEAVSDQFTETVDAAGTTIQDLGDAAESTIDEFAGQARSVISAGRRKLREIAPGDSGGVGGTIEQLGAGTVDQLLQGADAAVAMLADPTTAVPEAFDRVLEVATGNVEAFGDQLIDVAAAADSQVDQLAASATGILRAARRKVKALDQSAGDGLGGFLQGLTADSADLALRSAENFVSMVANPTEQVPARIGRMGELAVGTIEAAGQQLGDLADTGTEFYQDTLSTAHDVLQTGRVETRNWARGAAAGSVGLLGANAVDNLLSASQNVVDFLADPVGEVPGRLDHLLNLGSDTIGEVGDSLSGLASDADGVVDDLANGAFGLLRSARIELRESDIFSGTPVEGVAGLTANGASFLLKGAENLTRLVADPFTVAPAMAENLVGLATSTLSEFAGMAGGLAADSAEFAADVRQTVYDRLVGAVNGELADIFETGLPLLGLGPIALAPVIRDFISPPGSHPSADGEKGNAGAVG